MLKYAILLKDTGTRVLDEPDCETSFLDDLLEKNILDITEFPKEGIEYFRRRETEENDNYWNDAIELEEQIIRERVKRRRSEGQVPENLMEQDIRSQQWFLDANHELESIYGKRLKTAKEVRKVEG